MHKNLQSSDKFHFFNNVDANLKMHKETKQSSDNKCL